MASNPAKRWRPPVIKDPVPILRPCDCGHDPQVSFGPASVITCRNCKKKMTVKTPPFFGNILTQLEHQTWRVAEIWNGRAGR
jgi:hypothetical protein